MKDNSAKHIVQGAVGGVALAMLFISVAIVKIKHETKLEAEEEVNSFEIKRVCLRNGNEWIHNTCIPACSNRP